MFIIVPLFWPCSLLVVYALFAAVFSVVAAALSGGVVLPGIMFLFPFNYSQ